MRDKLPKRSEVNEELKWRLEDIYPLESDWEKDIEEALRFADEIAAFEGKALSSAENFLKVMEIYEKCMLKLHLTEGYAFKKRDLNTADSKGQTLNAKAKSASTEVLEKVAFLEPEIIKASIDAVEKYFEEKPELKRYEVFILDVIRMGSRVLSPEIEKILAAAEEMAAVPRESFAVLGNADLKFPSVTDKDGNTVDITDSRFVPLEESTDRELRKEVFEKYYETYGSFKNTWASLYYGEVKQAIFYKKVRKYPSTLAMAVDRTNVSPEVYDNLIEAVGDNLDKMHRYVRLRKKLLNVDELHMYDVYAPMINDYEMKFTIEEAKDLVLKAIEPLGEEYVNTVRDGFNNRWLDVVDTEGKRSGAYSSGVYGVHPFVLLNFNGTLDNVFTLAHEMGHAMHSYYSNKTQPFLDSEYKIFVAEVASTTNEVLLMKYMLKNVRNEREKAYLLNHFMDSFKGTVYRQTMFAEFERKSKSMAENGEPLTSENLTELYLSLNKKYYGEAMVSDELIGYEWMRIPHFYYNYYVYQYATGFSAAVAIANRILTEGTPAVKEYMAFLHSGCTKDPVSLLKIAGVDMSTKEPINSALETFGKVIDEMEKLVG